MKICEKCGERNWKPGDRCGSCGEKFDGDAWFGDGTSPEVDAPDPTESEQDFYKDRPQNGLFFD